MASIRHRNSNRKRLGLFERLITRVNILNRRYWAVKRVKMRLEERYVSDPVKFLQLLGAEILGSRDVQIRRVNAATVEDSKRGIIEWMYAEATVCTMNWSGDDGLCAEFSAEAEFSDGYTYVKFSKLEFRRILDLAREWTTDPKLSI